MIAQLSGRVVAVGGTWVVVELSGLGLKVLCTPATAAGARPGESIRLHTSLVVREDSLTLYGFAEAEERDCFELVQTASGIGPRIALAVVSVFTPSDFARAVNAGNTAAITKVPGIGAKGAAKLVLELKDKVTGLLGAGPTRGLSELPGDWRDQVCGALEGLGYSTRDAEAACDQVSGLVEADPDTPVSVLLRAALRTLAK
ncbi:Holliday junction DNA helicase subunit RuvA [Propionicimonas paludicola]|uniref:Holliday junction branch migration complex subunit RuvA n=1 Tax=Propionicimonas paludicola TaxID=185243 RepID=A0A2A9CQN6_9ACTN|nr:Holliday junction branch migration protein RuvA [Propionicimonas paludicola]PFG16744.1 Holliday junction DNA helicase subunit RuvA [Propionicimonas paludicola]